MVDTLNPAESNVSSTELMDIKTIIDLYLNGNANNVWLLKLEIAPDSFPTEISFISKFSPVKDINKYPLGNNARYTSQTLRSSYEFSESEVTDYTQVYHIDSPIPLEELNNDLVYEAYVAYIKENVVHLQINWRNYSTDLGGFGIYLYDEDSKFIKSVLSSK